MTFWTYMLHCNGGYFYVGHSDDLERRMAEHACGVVAGFAADHWPATLVWSEEFPTRLEALTTERKIKGWTRAKKLALIRGDWDLISALGKGKYSPSTSSGRTVRGGTRNTTQPFGLSLSKPRPFSLFGHSQTPHPAVSAVGVEIERVGQILRCRYDLNTPATDLVWAEAVPGRADELWRHTCCELFAKGEGEGYLEFNFTPSRQWAAYQFDRYREGMRNAQVEPPLISVEHVRDSLALIVEVNLPEPVSAIGLSAVIETRDGVTSYWALAHPPGKPDFHHPDCFALQLPAAG
ncbi:MAG: GIY-YIG nuclease family protein [Sphingomonadaceae bacterium]